jgi:hypothetical protein
VELVQEMELNLAVPAPRTVEVAVVVNVEMAVNLIWGVEVVAVESWLLVMILQILCL